MKKSFVQIGGATYYYYPCPRCLNGTMAWEKDTHFGNHYLKCVLCGAEKRQKLFLKHRRMPKNTTVPDTKVPTEGEKSGTKSTDKRQ